MGRLTSGELHRNQDLDHQSPFPRGKLGVSLGAGSSKAPEQGYNGAGISSSRVGNSKIPYTLTLSLPFPVVRNQDLDHTIKPRHWTRPKARTSIGWEHDSGTRKAARAGCQCWGE